MNITLRQPYSFCQQGQRGNQEDCRYPDCDAPDTYAPFFLVCDGVGGAEKGEVASHTVCDAFAHALSGTDWNEPFTDEDFAGALAEAYTAMNRKADNSNEGMATTLTFACFHGGGCTLAHMGDSRIYHIRPNVGILYRSEDHSLVNALVHSGNLTPEEAIGHRDSNVITRYIGVTKNGAERFKAAVFTTTDVEAGDYVFLCSDGVLKNIDDNVLFDILSSDGSDRDKTATLADLSRDSDDNNTAWLIPVETVDEKESPDKADAPTAETGTSKIYTPQEQAKDVEAEPEKTLLQKISNFLRRLS